MQFSDDEKYVNQYSKLFKGSENTIAPFGNIPD